MATFPAHGSFLRTQPRSCRNPRKNIKALPLWDIIHTNGAGAGCRPSPAWS